MDRGAAKELELERQRAREYEKELKGEQSNDRDEPVR